jgi:plasmid rolling circle replication initiator protein Rep
MTNKKNTVYTKLGQQQAELIKYSQEMCKQACGKKCKRNHYKIVDCEEGSRCGNTIFCLQCRKLRANKRNAELFQTRKLLYEDDPNLREVFLTFTIKNTDELGDSKTQLHKAYNKLKRTPEWGKAITGDVWAFEFTVNIETLLFHPHLHVLAVVSKDYFSKDKNGKDIVGKAYLNQKKWSALWKKAGKFDYDPLVHVKKVKTGGGINFEMSKYLVKDLPMIKLSDSDALKTWAKIHRAMRGKRTLGYCGLYKEAHKQEKINFKNWKENQYTQKEVESIKIINDNLIVYEVPKIEPQNLILKLLLSTKPRGAVTLLPRSRSAVRDIGVMWHRKGQNIESVAF